MYSLHNGCISVVTQTDTCLWFLFNTTTIRSDKQNKKETIAGIFFFFILSRVKNNVVLYKILYHIITWDAY